MEVSHFKIHLHLSNKVFALDDEESEREKRDEVLRFSLSNRAEWNVKVMREGKLFKNSSTTISRFLVHLVQTLPTRRLCWSKVASDLNALRSRVNFYAAMKSRISRRFSDFRMLIAMLVVVTSFSGSTERLSMWL